MSVLGVSLINSAVSVNNFERLIQTTPTHLSHHQALVTVENKKRKKSVDDEDASEAKKRKTSL